MRGMPPTSRNVLLMKGSAMARSRRIDERQKSIWDLLGERLSR